MLDRGGQMALTDVLRTFEPGRGHGPDLSVRWFDTWHGRLDDALAVLPEMETCPHELFRLLATNPGRTHKRIALVSRNGDPVAVAALRADDRHWKPVTEETTPRSVFPAAPGFLVPALNALGRDLWVSGWEELPGDAAGVRRMVPTGIYRAELATDYEAYWRETGHHKTVRQARNRTIAMTVKVDAPGGLEWNINGWAQRWERTDSDDTRDRMVAAKYLATTGQYHWLTLHDGDDIVAACSFLEYRGDVISQITHRLLGHEDLKLGTRVFDASFQWAAEAGYRRLDLGGGHDYKGRWAPPDGYRWSLNFCPLFDYRSKQCYRAARSMAVRTMAHSRGRLQGMLHGPDRDANTAAPEAEPGAVAR